jgi:hypothetical protein
MAQLTYRENLSHISIRQLITDAGSDPDTESFSVFQYNGHTYDLIFDDTTLTSNDLDTAIENIRNGLLEGAGSPISNPWPPADA